MINKEASENGVPLFSIGHRTLFFRATLQRREKYSVPEIVFLY